MMENRDREAEHKRRRQLSFTWKEGNFEAWGIAFEQWASTRPKEQCSAQNYIMHLIRSFGTDGDSCRKRADDLASELSGVRAEAYGLKMAHLDLEVKLAKLGMELDAERSKMRELAEQLEAVKADLAEQRNSNRSALVRLWATEFKMGALWGENMALRKHISQLTDILSARTKSGIEVENHTQEE